MSEKHSLFSPSSAHRWMRCAGSIALENTLPNSTSGYAEEGTAAHEIAALCLTRQQYADAYADYTAQNGVKCSADMAEHVQKYVDTVMQYAEGNDLLVEQRVDFSSFTGFPDSFGTADAIIFAGDEIQCHDLKYGMGVRVDAERNEQLMIYALGALHTFGMMGDFKRVRMVIHQPRLNAVSEWACSVEDLYGFAEQVRAAAASVVDVIQGMSATGEPRFMHEVVSAETQSLTPGEKQCRFCRAKAICPALAKEVSDATLADFSDETQTKLEPWGNTPFALSKYMAKIELIETWCKAVRAEVERRLLNGEEIPGYKLVEGKRGPRQWKDEQEAEDKLKAMRLKMEQMYTMKVISPTQAEKLLKDNPRRWLGLQSLITQREGQPSVAPVSDKRPALIVTNPVDDFEVVGDSLV